MSSYLNIAWYIGIAECQQVEKQPLRLEEVDQLPSLTRGPTSALASVVDAMRFSVISIQFLV